MLRYLSRNKSLGSYNATDEEKLLEVVVELTDFLNEDLKREPDEEEDDLEVLYPKFFKHVNSKASEFRGCKGYRELCCVPSFVLGLAMVGRVKRHYTHSSWFTIGQLSKMVGEYGGVSEMEIHDDGIFTTSVISFSSLDS